MLSVPPKVIMTREAADETTPLVPRATGTTNTLKWYQKAPVEPLAVVFMLTNGYTSTLRTQLLYKQVAMTLDIDPIALSTSDDHCGNRSDLVAKVQEYSATWIMYLTLVKMIFMIFSTLYFGSLSDRVGRRICLLLPAFGAILGAVADLVIDRFHLALPFFFLEVVEYLFGGILVMKLGCSALIADTVPEGRRSLRMTILDSLSFGAQALSAFLIGRLIPTLSLSFLVIIVGNMAVLLYATFLIPVTKLHINTQPASVIGINSDTTQESNTETSTSVCSHLLSCISVYTNNSQPGRRWKLNMLLFAFFISALSASGHIITLYEMNIPLCWDKDTISYFTLEDFLLKSVMMVLVVKVVRSRVKDDWLALSGRVSSVLEHVYLAFCIYTPMMFAAPALGCLNLLTEPMTKSLMTALVQPNEQGSLLAVFSLAPVLRMASGAVMAPIYKATLDVIRGAVVFLISAGVHSVSLCMLGVYIWRRRRSSSSEQNQV